ncbi:hypothetical protein [Flavobacterium sp. 3HN19-14]|uniref:hypothetical protein n=1 Tax=Flavobacterium sp. 3HN19-14 TaxID=3448133 RepID=UPI003EDFA103
MKPGNSCFAAGFPSHPSRVWFPERLNLHNGRCLFQNPTRACTNPTRGCTNRTRGCTNRTRACTNPTRACTNRTRGCTNPTRGCTNRTRACTNPTRACTNPTRARKAKKLSPPKNTLSATYAKPMKFRKKKLRKSLHNPKSGVLLHPH